MNHHFSIKHEDITLRPLTSDDIELLRKWRNDKNNTKYLRKIDYIEPDAQIRWFNDYLDDPSSIIFAIVDNKIVKGVVGSVSIYDIKGDVAEIGRIMIGDERAHHRNFGRRAMILAMMVGFEKLNVKRYHASVHENNAVAYNIYMSIGFSVKGSHLFDDGGKELDIEINREDVNTNYIGNMKVTIQEYDQH